MSAAVRKRVSAVIVHHGRILGFQAEDPYNKKRYFFLPGGERENGESVAETARRETLEETGYTIEVDESTAEFRRYEFTWNGRIYLSETWFVAGRITEAPPREVNDAAYHRGVDWVKVEDIDKVFSYHPDILEPVRHLVEAAAAAAEKRPG